MLRAAVCDDERQFLLAMEELLQKTGRVETVRLFESGEELIEELDAGTELDVVFLDIDFHGISEGLDFATRMYECAPSIQIVYVTGYTDKFVQDVFLHTANLCGFLKKPVETEVLEQFLKKAKRLREEYEKSRLVVTVKGCVEVVPFSEIIYLESIGHRLLLHMEKGEKQIYEKLEDVRQRLPEDLFLHCHKSFLVNMEKILRLETDRVALKNGQEIAISKRKLKESRRRYFEYLERSV